MLSATAIYKIFLLVQSLQSTCLKEVHPCSFFCINTLDNKSLKEANLLLCVVMTLDYTITIHQWISDGVYMEPLNASAASWRPTNKNFRETSCKHNSNYTCRIFSWLSQEVHHSGRKWETWTGQRKRMCFPPAVNTHSKQEWCYSNNDTI